MPAAVIAMSNVRKALISISFSVALKTGAKCVFSQISSLVSFRIGAEVVLRQASTQTVDAHLYRTAC